MLIDENRIEQALKKLATTDHAVADLRADMERAEFRAKATKDALFLRLSGSVADRQAQASTHEEYAAAMSEYFTALSEYEAMRNDRSREVIIIDLYRSLLSAQKAGLIQ